ncbi:MAG: hypothetical protein K0R15_1695 [Clostridiales bacterium]|jgi:hypothetical protein|nr:hypothetical protein [Clostridiales bacterium]
MSSDIIRFLVENNDKRKTAVYIALQCAPVLSGKKASSIIILKNKNNKILKKSIRGTGVLSIRLYSSDEKTVFLLFRKELLVSQIDKCEIQGFLDSYGYKGSLNDILIQLIANFEKFYKKEKGFPHEIGAFLGYPIEDVKAFIECKGANCIMSGYWKVYSSPDTAKKIFQQYDEVREEAAIMIIKGNTFLEFANKYGYGRQSNIA